MASAEPSSTRRVRRVKTERIRKIIIRRFIDRNITTPLRMLEYENRIVWWMSCCVLANVGDVKEGEDVRSNRFGRGGQRGQDVFMEDGEQSVAFERKDEASWREGGRWRATQRRASGALEVFSPRPQMADGEG